MAASVVQNLRDFGAIEPDALLADFVRRFDPVRGYGSTIGGVLMRLQESGGTDGRERFAALFEGQGSFGNGAAMRVSPVGAFFADTDLPDVAEQATRSATATHTHPEGIAGAVAVATVIAWQHRGNRLPRPAFLDAVLSETPPSETAAKIRLARNFAPGVSVRFAGAVLGTGFAEAMWQTVSAMGDRDTTCALVGGIVVMNVGAGGIPADFLARREPLPVL